MIILVKILTTFGSVISIGFGVWHFFVPTIWKWYQYIDSSATELVLAVRAINIFFSLSLVLIGITNLIFVYANFQNRLSLIVILLVSSILWATRFLLQIMYPQGSLNPLLQYGMLSVFILVFLSYAISLFIILVKNAV